MSTTAWIVLGVVALGAGYMYYQGQLAKADATVQANPATALNTLASNTPAIINALGDAFSAEHTSVEGGYQGYS